MMRDRQFQAKLLLAAHKMLMAAGVECSSTEYLDQWLHVRDAERDTAIAEVGKIGRQLGKAQAENDRLRDAIRWAFGEAGEFPVREDGQGNYYWRTELRRRAALKQGD